jgi:addiction module HigA family antidote
MTPNLFQPSFQPDYACPPGTTLRQVLEQLGLSQSELAERTGRPKKTINEIIQGKAAITADTALQLERVLGIDATFWLNLERAYQAIQARAIEDERLVTQVAWLDQMPVREMIRRGWIKPHTDRVALLREVLAFFGVAFPEAWPSVWDRMRKVAAFRQGQSQEVDFAAIATWMRKGEIEGRLRNCGPYSPDKFRAAIDLVRTLTNEPAERLCPRIENLCADAGVAVVFVPELPRLKLFGSAQWLSPDKALIELSLFYKREDQLIFSFFHEAAHIILHGRREVFVDVHGGVSDRQEDEANRFAADLLIPQKAYEAYIRNGRFSESSVLQFAKTVNIAPGIVVGRLQHDRHIGFNWLNHLRRPVEWGPDNRVRRATR